MLRTHRAGKGPGVCGGWGLDSRNGRGPGVPPTPGLRGRRTSPGSPAGFLGSSGWGKALFSSPALEVWDGPSHLPLLISPASLLCPQDPRSLDGALWRRGAGLGAQQAPGLSAPGNRPPLLSSSSQRVPPACLS